MSYLLRGSHLWKSNLFTLVFFIYQQCENLYKFEGLAQFSHPDKLFILKLFSNPLGYLIKDGKNNTFLQIFRNLNNFLQIFFETKFCPKILGDRNLTRNPNNPNPNTQIQFGLGNG